MQYQLVCCSSLLVIYVQTLWMCCLPEVFRSEVDRALETGTLTVSRSSKRCSCACTEPPTPPRQLPNE